MTFLNLMHTQVHYLNVLKSSSFVILLLYTLKSSRINFIITDCQVYLIIVLLLSAKHIIIIQDLHQNKLTLSLKLEQITEFLILDIKELKCGTPLMKTIKLYQINKICYYFQNILYYFFINT